MTVRHRPGLGALPQAGHEVSESRTVRPIIWQVYNTSTADVDLSVASVRDNPMKL